MRHDWPVEEAIVDIANQVERKKRALAVMSLVHWRSWRCFVDVINRG